MLDSKPRTTTVRRLGATAVSALALGAALAVGALVGSGDASSAPGSAQQELTRLRAEVATLEQDAKFWRQLVSGFPAAKALGMNSMADHRLLILPSGVALALHFDNVNLAKAKNLNWVALAIPGQFTKADQARVNRLYGPGFTHFHVFNRDVHAGRPGEKGVWFVHVGARDFRSPFGLVKDGKVDLRFMPTRPPR
jgi:hypothetical protein